MIRRTGLLLCVALVLVAAGAHAGVVRSLEGFSAPSALAALKGGKVAVLESGLKRVAIVDAKGKRSVLKGLSDPRGLASDEQGEVIVLDRLSKGGWGVVRFSEGRSLGHKALKSEVTDGDAGGGPREPVAIAASNRILWVVDRKPPRVLLYGYDGEALAEEPLADFGVRMPAGISIDHEGEVFVTDAFGPSVVRMSLSGSVVSLVELSEKGFARPTGVACGGGRLWVADSITGIVALVGFLEEAAVISTIGKDFEGISSLIYSSEGVWFAEKVRGRIGLLDYEEGE
jgi:hypothetical protein